MAARGVAGRGPAARAGFAAVRPALRGHGWHVARAVGWQSAFRLLPLQVPLLTGALIDALHAASTGGVSDGGGRWTWLGATPSARIPLLAGALLMVALLQGIAATQASRSAASVTRRVVARLRYQLAAAWTSASLEVHRRFGASELLGRTVRDVDAVRQFVKAAVIDAPTAVLRIAWPAAMLVLIDPWLSLVPMAALPVQWLATWRTQQGLTQAASESKDARARLATGVQEHLDGIETVLALDAGPVLLERLGRHGDVVEASQLESNRQTGFTNGAMWAATAAAYAIVWWLGALRALDGRMSIGELVAFAGFVRFLNLPFRQLSRIGTAYRVGVASLARAEEVLSACEAEARQGPPIVAHEGRVELCDLRLAADARLRCGTLNLAIPPRSLTLIVGPSGAGKTLLLRTLAGLVAPAAGRVLVDGQDLHAAAPASVRSQVAYVPQRSIVFAGTVSDNLRLARPDASDDELRAACDASAFMSVLARLPAGLETVLGPDGIELSSGEAQCLALARALLREPQVLLLDATTTAMDSETEAHVLDRLAFVARHRTVVLVAHRLGHPPPGIRTIGLDVAPPNEPSAAECLVQTT